MLNEILVLTLLAVGSVSGAWLLGARSTLLAIPTGLLLATVARILIFSTFNMLNIREFAASAFYVVLAATIVMAALRARDGLYRPVVAAVAAGLIGTFCTRVLGVLGTRHGDSYWILAVSHLMQKSGDMTILDGHTPLKRGFAYPLLLALGPQDQFLSGITPYIFFAMLCAIGWVLWELVKKQPRGRVYTVAAVLAAICLTATMPLRAIFYINGHTLFAVGLVVAVGVSVLALRDKVLSNAHLVALCAGVYVATSTRAEGVAIMAIVILPVISLRFVSRLKVAVVITSLTASFAIWQATYNSYLIPNGMPWIVFMVILIGAGFLPVIKWFDWLRFRIFLIGLIGLVAVYGAAEIKWHSDFRRGHIALVYNLFFNLNTKTLGSGGWGLMFAGLILLMLIAIFSRWSPEFRYLLMISAMLIVGSFIAKMLDGGQFGHPDLGRVGWSDSLNRMWLQTFGIFVITVAVGLIQNEKIWQRLGAKSKGE
jgi:hypothetical protein